MFSLSLSNSMYCSIRRHSWKYKSQFLCSNEFIIYVKWMLRDETGKSNAEAKRFWGWEQFFTPTWTVIVNGNGNFHERAFSHENNNTSHQLQNKLQKNSSRLLELLEQSMEGLNTFWTNHFLRRWWSTLTVTAIANRLCWVLGDRFVVCC